MSHANWERAPRAGWTGSYQQVHHVGLVVPQRLHGVEDVHRPLVPEHLTDNADGAEGPAAASPVPVGRGGEAGGGPGSLSHRTAPTTCVHLLPEPSWLPPGPIPLLMQMGPRDHLTGGDAKPAHPALPVGLCPDDVT